jgi:hypothetical protein
VRLVFLALYGSELHPSARVWCDLKDALTWQQFTDPDAQETYVGDLLLENLLR